jgi:pyruvate/2-oxoglutarate dehydrogenase complex dihydrolipoamide dehydrogenase (E3) component
VALTARHAVVICTGSRTALPELAGLAEARPWTNRQATDSHTVPRRLAIVGGGAVGVEMASAWSGLGSSVILLAQADGPLVGNDSALSRSTRASARARTTYTSWRPA